MSLTHDFKETIRARAERDPEYRRGLFCNAVVAMLSGELETMKAALRSYVNLTIGFPDLAKRTGFTEKI